MSKILTPNVFITNNYELANEFFNKGVYKNVDELPNVSNALVISGKTNKYLQSLEYSVNFDNDNNPGLTLEFLDTDGNFEQSFFMHLTNTGKSMLQNAFRSDAAKATPSVKIGGGTFEITNGRVDVRESDLSDIKNYANNWNRLFIAFGTDNILNNWSDVMTFVLNKTTVDISNGLRRYTFKFFSTNDSIFRPKLRFNFENPNPPREFLYLENIDKLIVTIDKNDAVDTLENIIYRLVRKYLSTVARTPESNIIGIIPNLGEYVSFDSPFIEGRSTPQQISISTQNLKYYLKNFGISEANKFREYNVIASRLIKTPNVDLSPQAYDATNQTTSKANLSSIDSYVLKCDKQDSSVNPGFPDFYDALNKIDKGIKSRIKTIDNFIITTETNIKLLSFWKSKGLIKDASIGKCIIFGPEQMISEYLYRNYIPLENAAASIDQSFNLLQGEFKPSLQIYKGRIVQFNYQNDAFFVPDTFVNEDSLYSFDNTTKNNVANILLDNNYGSELLKLMSKGKTSSNFFEQINIDELAVNGDSYQEKVVELFKTKNGILELFEIPVFLNNFTNANVLNIQYANSETYLAGVQIAISNNFNSAYLASIANNANKVNIGGLNLSSVFDNYAKILENYNLDKEKIKKALTQQFYFAKNQGIKLELEKYSNSDKNALQRENIFTQLKKIKPIPKPLLVPSTSDRVKSFIKQYGIFSGPAKALYETSEEIEARLAKDLGEIIPSSGIISILDDLSKLFINFDSLIYKSNGNINVDELLFAAAISFVDPTPKYRKFDLNGASRASLTNFDYIGSEISKQEQYLNLANMMFTLFDIRTLDDGKGLDQGVVFKPKQFGLSQENIAAELWNALNSQQIKLNIKTLPFFHLATYRLLNFKPCFLFSKQVTPININSTNNSTNLDFFSGLYNIAAIKHVINTRECYSQFMLQKNVGSAYRL
jgi:hypothetical protein